MSTLAPRDPSSIVLASCRAVLLVTWLSEVVEEGEVEAIYVFVGTFQVVNPDEQG